MISEDAFSPWFLLSIERPKKCDYHFLTTYSLYLLYVSDLCRALKPPTASLNGRQRSPEPNGCSDRKRKIFFKSLNVPAGFKSRVERLCCVMLHQTQMCSMPLRCWTVVQRHLRNIHHVSECVCVCAAALHLFLVWRAEPGATLQRQIQSIALKIGAKNVPLRRPRLQTGRVRWRTIEIDGE